MTFHDTQSVTSKLAEQNKILRTRVEELEKEIERHKKYIKFITEKYNEEF